MQLLFIQNFCMKSITLLSIEYLNWNNVIIQSINIFRFEQEKSKNRGLKTTGANLNAQEYFFLNKKIMEPLK